MGNATGFILMVDATSLKLNKESLESNKLIKNDVESQFLENKAVNIFVFSF